jgi:hypothetical protein
VGRGRARLDRDRDGLLVFFVGVVLLCVAAAVYLLTDLLVAAAPVVMLASLIAVSCMTPNAPRRGVGQWRGARGASCEDHGWSGGRRLGDFARVCFLFVSSSLQDASIISAQLEGRLKSMGFCNQ